MHARRVRLVVIAAGLLVSGAARATPTVRHAAGGLRQLVASQATVNVTVSARMAAGGGGVGRVELEIDSVPPDSAPTTPAISCRTDSSAGCVGAAALGSTVRLKAVDVSNATFVSWSGCTSIAGGVCTVTMTVARTITANFRPTAFNLTAKTVASGGSGFLTAPTSPPIDCQTGSADHTACTGGVPNGATGFVVTAVPAAGSKVTVWAGCTPTTATTCTLPAMTGARVVSAAFGPGNYLVTAQVSGGGTVTAAAGGSVVDGMSCPADCTAEVVPGGSITLTATPAAGNDFLGWTGCTSPSGSQCTLPNVTAATVIAATFRASSCQSCHDMPPAAPHVARSDCGTCHPGYTSQTVVPALHMNGRVDPTHADALGDTCTTDPDVASRCVTCHPCMGR